MLMSTSLKLHPIGLSDFKYTSDTDRCRIPLDMEIYQSNNVSLNSEHAEIVEILTFN